MMVACLDKINQVFLAVYNEKKSQLFIPSFATVYVDDGENPSFLVPRLYNQRFRHNLGTECLNI